MHCVFIVSLLVPIPFESGSISLPFVCLPISMVLGWLSTGVLMNKG